MAIILSPIANFQQFFNNTGFLNAGGKLFTYANGTTNNQDTYSDSTGNTENSNPIVLDSSGRLPTDIWIEDSWSYTFVVTLPDGTTVLDQVDGIGG